MEARVEARAEALVREGELASIARATLEIRETTSRFRLEARVEARAEALVREG